MNKKEKTINQGVLKYDNFVINTLGNNKVMTPTSGILEILGLLEKDSREFLGIAMEELSKNFENDFDLRVIDNKLYKIWKSEELELY